MGDLVGLPAFHDDRVQRARFEAWLLTVFKGREASEMTARKASGRYLMQAAEAAWCGWRARGLTDAEALGIKDAGVICSVSEVPLQ